MDYSPTLGAISRELSAVQARLQAIEAKPGLALSPAALTTQVKQAGEGSRLDLTRTQGQLKAAVEEIEALAGQVRTRTAQRDWLIATGMLGALMGVCLWIVLIRAVLPAGAAAWLAALPIGGGPWHAGQRLMEEASPASWDRMVRLYRACPAESAVEQCEVAMTTPAVASGAEPAKAPNPGPVPSGSHTRAGR